MLRLPRVPRFALAAWCSLVAGTVAAQGPPPEARPNILLISVCSMRSDHMSCYGYDRETTPSLARLASESIVFDSAVTQWPKTTPGFAAVMSAKYGHSNGVLRATHGPRLADVHVTLAEALRQAGYETAAFVSSPALGLHANLQQGFDLYEEVFRDRRRHVMPALRAVDWLRSRKSESPFFVWAHFNNAHYPYHGGGGPPDIFVGDRGYDPSAKVRVATDPRARLKLPVAADHPLVREILRPDMGFVHRWAVLEERPDELAFYIARYDAGIRGADEAIGLLLRSVREAGLVDSTIIAVVGDHGESLGDQGYFFEHGRLPYESTARVPLMVRPAGKPAPERVRAPVATFSVAPTLLQMAGVARPDGWEARSLIPLVKGQEPAPPVFMEAGYQDDYMLVVRDDTFKLIHVPNPVDRQLMRGSEYELYRWREDPGEQRNLADTLPDQVRRLGAMLRSWFDPWRSSAYGAKVTEAPEVDEVTRRQLETLGYVD